MKKHSFSLPDAALLLLRIFLCLLVVFPCVYAFLGSFKTADEFSRLPPRLFPDSFLNLSNYEAVFTLAPMGRYFFNSAGTTLLVCIVKLLSAMLAAYAFTYFDFRFKKTLFVFLLGTMMIPADTVIVTNYQTVSRLALTDTWLGIAIVSFAGASQMFMLTQAFSQAPLALRQAAFLDGCSDLRFLFSVLLPYCRPVWVTLFMQAFVAQWNAYLWPLLVTNSDRMRTVQVGISMLTSTEDTNYQVILAGTVAAILPPVLLFILVRRLISHSLTEGAVSG